jgi:iron complex outermembrane receptor protein
MMHQRSILLISSLLLPLLFVAAQEPLPKGDDSTFLLNEVVVNAHQTNLRWHHLPGNISVLAGTEVQRGYGDSFASILHALPGIYMHSGTYATNRIVIRGMGSRTPYNTNRIKAYLNDIPITSSDGISSPEDIDLDGIGRIEIIKGPASALYGSGLGGNINLSTPAPLRSSFTARLQVGSFNTAKASAGGSYVRDDLKISGNVGHIRSDGFRENNRLRRTSLLSSGRLEKSAHTLEYTLLLLEMDAAIPSSIGKTLFETDPGAAAPNWKAIEGFKRYGRGVAGISLENRLGEGWVNRLTTFGRWTESYEKRPFNNLTDGTYGGGVRDRLSFHAERYDILVGLEWISDTYRWRVDREEAIINRNSETRYHLNFFTMIHLRPSPKWNISLGGAVNRIRYRLKDRFPDNGDQGGERTFPLTVSPRIGINYAPDSKVALYASVGHGFSMPSPEETLLPEGSINRGLKPEQGWQYEAGIRLNLLHGTTQIDATLYRIDLHNLIVTKRLTDEIFTGINAGRSRHRGIELLWRQQVFYRGHFPGSLNINSSCTFSQNRFVDFTDDGNIYDGNQLPGIPSHLFQTYFDWKPLEPLHLGVRFQYTGKQFINDANSVTADGYQLTDAKVGYLLPITTSGRVELHAGVNNATGTHYASMLTVNAVAAGNAEPRYYYPGAPRHFYIGTIWNF